MSDRIATFSQTGQVISNNLRLQRNFAEKQIQVSSGYKAQGYEGIARDASRLLNLESDYKNIQQQTDDARLAADRINTMWGAMGSMLSQVQKFNATLIGSMGPAGVQGADLANLAQTTLDQMTGGLNTQIGDRYIFSDPPQRQPRRFE